MNASFASWLVILLAALAANFPFMSERLFACLPLKRGSKPFGLRLLEMAVLYAAVLGIAHVLEAREGNVFAQRWEFYAVTVCMFVVLAFPGFVFRYLRKRRD